MFEFDFTAPDFTGSLSVALFAALFMCYFLQWWLARSRAARGTTQM